jgi:hypothetical protein
MCERGLGPTSGEKVKLCERSSSGRGRTNSEIRIILQKRDREILKLCYEQQFILSEQVRRFFFAGTNKATGLLRLKELEQAGLIRRLTRPTLNGKRLIRLTRLGLRMIQKDIVIDVPQVHIPDVATLEHDAFVTSTRLRLLELWTGSWLPERAIKREEFPRVPDGLFIFPSGTKAAIEVENSLKAKSRFMRLLEDWRHIDVKLVLFVVTTPHLLSNIQRFLLEGPRGVPFSLIQWETLMGEKPRVWTPSGMVDVFSRKEY